MTVVLVQGTRAVPVHAAVKATYLTPASVVFSFWFALGAAWLGGRRRRWLHAATALSAVLAVASCIVFLQGRMVGAWWLAQSQEGSLWRNVAGVVYYAGGETQRAEELFALAAADNHHLGWENLSAVALDAGRPLEALHDLRIAARLQPSQSLGTPADQVLFNQLTRAEYLNTMAVIYHQLGWDTAALSAAEAAVAADPTLPDAAYDLAVLKLARVDAADAAAAPWRAAYVAQSRRLLFNAVALDPGFREARALAGVAAALDGNCTDAVATIEQALAPGARMHRSYPVDTGVGDLLASAVRRRRHITELPEAVRPDRQLARCRDERGTIQSARGGGDA
jgi:tetratricopeptide (TPR) repeat protein